MLCFLAAASISNFSGMAGANIRPDFPNKSISAREEESGSLLEIGSLGALDPLVVTFVGGLVVISFFLFSNDPLSLTPNNANPVPAPLGRVVIAVNYSQTIEIVR